jgi:carbon-monoxide dehydrogenase small subunit
MSATNLILNGEQVTIEAPDHRLLIDAVHERLGRATKVSCDSGACGACTMLVDGTPTAACSTFLFAVAGTRVETIEGLSDEDGPLHPVQQAFAESSAFQCGFCTAGMIMLVKGLLDRDPRPSRETIVSWLSSNLCRCTGYAPILRAVERAIELNAEATAAR